MIRWIGVTLLVAILAIFAWRHLSSERKGNVREELVLNILDTGQIHQIDILDREGEMIRLIREGKGWMVNNEPARQHAVFNLLATIHDQRVSALIPNAAMDNVVKDLGSNGVRIDVRDENDENMMTFYVGGVTPDERGTFMLREGSEWPVIVNVPGFDGALRSRYIMSILDWKSRQIIKPIKTISSLVLDYPTRQEHSLEILKTNQGYQVTPIYQPNVEPVPVHEYLVEAYLEQLNHLYAEAILDGSRREVLDASTPFCKLMVVEENGDVQKVEFFPTIWINYENIPDKPEKVERYYTDYNDKTIYLTQHLLMQKIFTSYEHFVTLKDFGKDN